MKYLLLLLLTVLCMEVHGNVDNDTLVVLPTRVVIYLLETHDENELLKKKIVALDSLNKNYILDKHDYIAIIAQYKADSATQEREKAIAWETTAVYKEEATVYKKMYKKQKTKTVIVGVIGGLGIILTVLATSG